jgi:hypothetical protein
MSDKEFDEEVRKALATKDAQKFMELADIAGDHSGRWIVMIRNCEALQSLDWIERQILRKGLGSDLMSHEIRVRREQIEADMATRAF